MWWLSLSLFTFVSFSELTLSPGLIISSTWGGQYKCGYSKNFSFSLFSFWELLILIFEFFLRYKFKEEMSDPLPDLDDMLREDGVLTWDRKIRNLSEIPSIREKRKLSIFLTFKLWEKVNTVHPPIRLI